ncbi:hypothetical protein D3C86_1828010 [compost metagenome]
MRQQPDGPIVERRPQLLSQREPLGIDPVRRRRMQKGALHVGHAATDADLFVMGGTDGFGSGVVVDLGNVAHGHACLAGAFSTRICWWEFKRC